MRVLFLIALSCLPLAAALGAAAQASVADQILATAKEARAIIASTTRRQLDSTTPAPRRQLAAGDTPAKNATCVEAAPLAKNASVSADKAACTVIEKAAADMKTKVACEAKLTAAGAAGACTYTAAVAAVTPRMQAKCIKGYPTNMMTESNGVTFIVPATGYCMNQEDMKSSILVTCDGKVLNGQNGKKPNCADITATTTKTDMGPGGYKCTSTDLVDGVELTVYQKKDCSDARSVGVPLKSGDCIALSSSIALSITCATDMITLSGYPQVKKAAADVKCTGAADKTITFKSGDGKCHNMDEKNGEMGGAAMAADVSILVSLAVVAVAAQY